MGAFHLATIFRLKFRKFSMSTEKRLSFHAEEKLAVSLADQNTWRDGARLTLMLDRAVEMV